MNHPAPPAPTPELRAAVLALTDRLRRLFIERYRCPSSHGELRRDIDAACAALEWLLGPDAGRRQAAAALEQAREAWHDIALRPQLDQVEVSTGQRL